MDTMSVLAVGVPNHLNFVRDMFHTRVILCSYVKLLAAFLVPSLVMADAGSLGYWPSQLGVCTRSSDDTFW